jgi:serine/threonine protein kinase
MKKKLLKQKKIACNNIEQALKAKKEVLELLGMGTFGVVFLGCLNDLCDEKIGVKFLTMKKKYNIDKSHPALVEILVGKELSKLVSKSITPHVNYTYKGLSCNIGQLKDLKTIKKSEWYNKRIFDIESNNYYSDFIKNYYKDIMVIFIEIADMDFKEYVTNIYENGGSLTFEEQLSTFFCFCYTMCCVVFYNPNYRHNDIKPNNLLITMNKNYNPNNYIHYKIFGKSFYIPQTKYLIKLHDFDYSNCDEIPNQKITNFSGLFKEINATPFTNPVYDLHEYLNFYIRDFGKYIEGTKIDTYFKSLFSQDTFGEENIYTRRYKLTNYKVNGQKTILSDEKRYNYIPKDMKTPSELILTDTVFNRFKTLPSNGIVTETYDSKIPSIQTDDELLYRSDMFNVLLKN